MHVIDQLSDVEFVLSQLEDYMFHRRAQSNDNIKHIGACHGVQEQPTTNLLSFFIALKTTYAKRSAYARTTYVCIHDFSNSFWPIYSVVPQNILHLHLQTVQFLFERLYVLQSSTE